MMGPPGVLIFGYSDASTTTGLKADEKIIAALQVSTATVSTGAASRHAEGVGEQIVETTPTDLRSQTDDASRGIDLKAVKIGAMFTEEAVQIASGILQQNAAGLLSVIDAEPFFKTGAPPEPELIAALRTSLLSSATLLTATVPEVMQLFENAAIPANYPRGMPDVQALATTLARELSPQYVLIKREFIDEDDGAITLHYVLAIGSASTPPIMSTSRFANPNRVRGASYYIPSAIAAHLARGLRVPEAVSAGFEFIGKSLERGEL